VPRVTLDEIRAAAPRLAELCRKYGIAELSVFGSVVRGEAKRRDEASADR
jgi:predicted nucleotidyltransferase